jgi:putative FmdB family regulatory protein
MARPEYAQVRGVRHGKILILRRETGVPLYEYECEKCGKHFEKIEKLQGPHLKKCPSCAGRVERLMSAPAIQFKGSGWYVTDYPRASRGGEKTDGSTAEKSETKADPKAESKTETKTETKTASEGKEKKKAGKEK